MLAILLPCVRLLKNTSHEHIEQKIFGAIGLALEFINIRIAPNLWYGKR